MATANESPPDEWRSAVHPKSKQPYEFIPRVGAPGIIVRREGETAEQARTRDAQQLDEKRARKREQQSDRPRGKGRKKDPTPSAAGRAQAEEKKGPSSEQLAAGVEVLLVPVSSFYTRTVLQCAFCANNALHAAPAAALDIARYSERNAYLRALLVWWHTVISGVAGAEGLAKLIGVPLIHHGAPEPMAAFISPILGIPPRDAARSPHTAHTAPPTGPTESPGSPPAPPPPAGGAPPPAGVPPPPPTLTPEQAAQLARMQTEAARVQAAREMGARQAAEAIRSHAAPTIPPYRADHRTDADDLGMPPEGIA